MKKLNKSGLCSAPAYNNSDFGGVHDWYGLLSLYVTHNLYNEEAHSYMTKGCANHLGVQGRQAAYTIPKVIFAFFVILHITFDSLVYIHANIRKLTRITYIPAYGNWYGYWIWKINMEVGSGLQMYTRKFSQLVYIALNITIYCLHIYKHLLYFLCVQILICTNRTECHRTCITGEANTCK